MTQDATPSRPTDTEDPIALAHQRAREALARAEEMSRRLRPPPTTTDPLALAQQQARDALRRVEEMRERMRDAIARADNREHTVRITMTPSGEIIKLYLDPECMRMAPDDLAREIIKVHHTAIVMAQQMADAAFGEQTGLPADLAAQARRGELDVRGMLGSMGLTGVLEPIEKLAGGKIV